MVVEIKKEFISFNGTKYVHTRRGGELSFRNLQDFNAALLAKKLYRLIDKPECLFSKVFKGIYFQIIDPLVEHISYSSSYGWRSICSTRSLAKNG